jgi:hypothetical protein
MVDTQAGTSSMAHDLPRRDEKEIRYERMVVRIVDLVVQLLWWAIHLGVIAGLNALPSDLHDGIAQLSGPAPSACNRKTTAFAALFAATVAAYYCTRASDPGFVVPAAGVPQTSYRGTDEWDIEVASQTPGGLDQPASSHRECRKCGAGPPQPPSTKHCRICDRCVRGWDHHCGWVGTCVGQNNHRVFWLYLLLQVREREPPFFVPPFALTTGKSISVAFGDFSLILPSFDLACFVMACRRASSACRWTS